jgi:hypothetical protein
LEPVYKNGGGGMPKWVEWFMNSFVEQPSLAFAYTQAGQENSFGWDAMRKGLTNQIALFAELAKAGKIRVETLEQSGRWFRENYPFTPPTSVVALDDWKNEGHKTVWYDSRFYRMNVLWERDEFFIRDIHRFDEQIVSATHERPLKQTSLAYDTLPIVDWAFWSDGGRKRAGMWPLLLKRDGVTAPMLIAGQPSVRELNSTDLCIDQPLKGGGKFLIVCKENELDFAAEDAQGKPLKWAFEMLGNQQFKSLVKQVAPTSITYDHNGVEYQLKLGSKSGTCVQLADGSVQLKSSESGSLVFQLDGAIAVGLAKE